jgi:hypothetical protein
VKEDIEEEIEFEDPEPFEEEPEPLEEPGPYGAPGMPPPDGQQRPPRPKKKKKKKKKKKPPQMPAPIQATTTPLGKPTRMYHVPSEPGKVPFTFIQLEPKPGATGPPGYAAYAIG